MLVKFCGTRKVRKRIFLITDGERASNFTEGDFNTISKTIKENDVKLNAITLDFCNELGEEDSDKDEDKDTVKAGEDQIDNKMEKENTETGDQTQNKEFLFKL